MSYLPALVSKFSFNCRCKNIIWDYYTSADSLLMPNKTMTKVSIYLWTILPLFLVKIFMLLAWNGEFFFFWKKVGNYQFEEANFYEQCCFVGLITYFWSLALRLGHDLGDSNRSWQFTNMVKVKAGYDIRIDVIDNFSLLSE